MAEQAKKATLVELSLEDHADLKLDPSCAIKVAENQHLINLKVSELSMAVSSSPVFLSQTSDSSEWTVSAINSFEMDKNLFVEDGKWTGTHVPIGMQTYPFFLMRKDGEENNLTIGINEESEAFSKEEGEALFEDGKASVRLSQATAQLEVEIKNNMQTYQFAKKLSELELIKPVDVQVIYQDGKTNILKGLNTIDEAKFNELNSEQFEEIRKAGFLPGIYSMLISIYQFNNLIRLHNKQSDAKVVQVKLETPKEEAAA